MAKELSVPIGVSTEELAGILARAPYSALLKYAGDGSYALKLRSEEAAKWAQIPVEKSVSCIRVVRPSPDAEFVDMVQEALDTIARDPVSPVVINEARVDLYYYPRE